MMIQQMTIRMANGAIRNRSLGLEDITLATKLRLNRATNPQTSQRAAPLAPLLTEMTAERARTVQMAPRKIRAEMTLMILSVGVSMSLLPP